VTVQSPGRNDLEDDDARERFTKIDEDILAGKEPK